MQLPTPADADSQDAAGLAEGILTALTDCARVDALTRNARAVLEDRYGTGERARAYAELLRLVGG